MRKTMVEYKTDWNRLIAEFMEMTPCLTSEGDFLIKGNPIEAKYLPYATDWNWLMPVIEKIESLRDNNGDAYRFTIDMCNAQIEGTEIEIIGGENKIKTTHQAVVEFINLNRDTMEKTNRLIAEFMGLKEHEGSYYLPLYNSGDWVPDVELEYHTDWNWLMPVVEKIESLGLVCFEKNLQEEGGYQAIFTKGYDILICHYADKSIDATYMAVVEFIKDQK
jgi:hypothetical protein